MPTYEYACRDCGEHLEVVQSFKDDALTTCPACSGSLRKVFSAAGIIFKGSGWHVKDYASSGRPGGSAGDSSDAGGSSSESDKAATASDTATSDGTAGNKADKKPSETPGAAAGSGGSGSSTASSGDSTAQKKSA